MAYLAWFIGDGQWSLLGTHRTQEEAMRQCLAHAAEEIQADETLLIDWVPCRNGITTSVTYEGRYEVIETEAGS